MTCMRYWCDKLHRFTVGDGCAKLSLTKRLSIRVLITRVWEPFFMPSCTVAGPCSQHMRKIGGTFNFWSWDEKGYFRVGEYNFVGKKTFIFVVNLPLKWELGVDLF